MGEFGRILVKTAMQPEYFDKFQCLGGACRYTCCQNWNIYVDRSDYLKMKNTRKSPELQKRVEATLKRLRGEMTEKGYAQFRYGEDGKCPLLSEEGLCALQLECGYDCLSNVCKVFPRLELVLPSCVARACSTGCEAVVKLMLEEKGPLKFREVPLPKEQWKIMDSIVLYAQAPLLRYEREIRTLCLAIAQNRGYPMEQRMLLLGIALRDLDDIQSRRAVDEVPDWLVQKSLMARGTQFAEALGQLPSDEAKSLDGSLLVLRLFLGMEGADRLLAEVVDTIQANLGWDLYGGGKTLEGYRRAKAESAPLLKEYEYLLEHFTVNYMFYMGVPFAYHSSRAWDNAVGACLIYNYFRFALLCCPQTARDPEELVHWLTVCSRGLLHNTARQDFMLEALQKLHVDDLAHLAMILNG